MLDVHEVRDIDVLRFPCERSVGFHVVLKGTLCVHTDGEAAPLIAPVLHATKDRRSRDLPCLCACVFGPILRLRKTLLYAITTVRSTRGVPREPAA